MKRKKFLACCLAMSMMLVSASPMAVSAEAQEDLFYSEELGVDGAFENEEAVEAEESVDDGFTSQQTEETDLFAEDAGSGTEGTDENDGWKTLTTLKKEERILYKYDENEKTLYFKCTEPIALPDYNYGNRTDWFVDLGVDKIAQIKKIVIGEGITGIGDFCFETKTASDAYANLEEVELASTVTVINRGAFGDDAALRKINLNNVKSIGQAAFSRCAVENITIEAPEVEFGGYAFSYCSSLQSVKTKKITSIGEDVFDSCSSLESFIYEGNLENIPRKAFYKTALAKFDFGNVKTVAAMAFRNCGLKAGCYAGTREEWSNIVGTNKDLINVTVHCKGDAVAPKAATCEEEGLKAVGTCEVCGEEYSYADEENKLPALEHDYADTYTEDKAATCTEAGSKSKHCTREGCDSKTDVQEIPALGHDYVSKVTKEATCTEKGVLTKTCSRCNDVVIEDIPALGHSFTENYTVDKAATCTEDGEQSKHCTREGCDARDDVQAIKAAGHKFGEWKVTAEATVFAPEQQERICEICGVKETKAEGTALKATASVNTSTVKLKVKQSTSGLKVTGLANGDSVKTWKSTNTKIFTVKGNADGTCKLTAKKAGTAKLQITLASGLKKTVTVKVQKAAVKTTKVTVESTKVTVKKGKKVTLKPVVAPFTSKQKVTYTTSNKKVATVSKNGVVTGKKKGTAKITVKSGNKSVKVTVKVK